MRITENRLQTYEQEHAAKIAALAPECTVLLKKDSTFPLKAPGKIALYGAGVRHTIRGGSGSGEVNIRHFETVEDAMQSAGFTITTTAWLDSYDAARKKAGECFYQQMKVAADAAGVPVSYLLTGQTVPEPIYEFPLDGEGDTAVYVLARNSGEGADRKQDTGDMALTETEIRDILALNTAYDSFMLVLNVGGAVDLTPVMAVKNILLLGQLGTPTAKVLADILLGKVYPSGKLAMTWAPLETYPSTEGFGNPNDTVYSEGVYVGYRYFDLAQSEVLFPFGYGKGYTDFEITPQSVSAQGDRLTVLAKVKNVGAFPGKEVVQVYLTAPGREIDRPWKELAATVKTCELHPQEEAVLEASFSLKNYAYYDEKQATYILEGGQYLVHLGSDSQNTVCIGVIDVPHTFCTEKLKNICPVQQEIPPFKELEQMQAKRKKMYSDALSAHGASSTVQIDLTNWKTNEVDYAADSEIDAEVREKTAQWDNLLAGKVDETDFAAALSDRELEQLACGDSSDNTDLGSIIGSAAKKVAGAAGETTRKLTNTSGVPSIVLADGPAGVRISPAYTLEDGNAKPAAAAFGSGMAEFMPPEEQAAMNSAMGIAEQADDEEIFYQYCTAIPVGTALAQAFNPAVAEVCGDIVGTEMGLFDVSIWLAPALNIQRSPLCGRNFEYYSEDPLVSGTTAAAVTCGVQQHPKCGVTIKHFACNNQETNRYRSNSIVSERAMREIYLKGFEYCIYMAKPACVMTSYNLINGEHACNSYDLLTNVLRREWGFDGIVMTDWFVTSAMISGEKDSIHKEASAAGCVKAGNNLIMPGLATDIADMQAALNDSNHPYVLCRADLVHNAAQMLRFIRKYS